MSSKTPEEPEDKSHNILQFFPQRQVHMPSAPGPSSSMATVVLPPGPSDLPIAPLGSNLPDPLRPSEKDRVVPLGMTDTCLRSHSSQGQASNLVPADSPSTVTESSRHPGAEYSDGDSEVSPSSNQVSAKSKKKRTRTLTTAPQAAALFGLLARVSLGRKFVISRLTHSHRLNFLRRASEKRLGELLVYQPGRFKSVLCYSVQRVNQS